MTTLLLEKFFLPQLKEKENLLLALVHFFNLKTSWNNFFIEANSNITAFQKVEKVKKRGVDYVRPVNTTTTIEVGGPKVHLDGLFGGNEELSEYNIVWHWINKNVYFVCNNRKTVVCSLCNYFSLQIGWLIR